MIRCTHTPTHHPDTHPTARVTVTRFKPESRVPTPESLGRKKERKKALWAGMGEVNKRTDKLPSLPSFLLSASCFGKSWRGDFQVLGGGSHLLFLANGSGRRSANLFAF